MKTNWAGCVGVVWGIVGFFGLVGGEQTCRRGDKWVSTGRLIDERSGRGRDDK